VYGLLRVEDSVSPTVSGGEVLLTLIGFTVVYGVLAAVDLFLMRKYAREGTTGETSADEVGAAMAY